MRKQIAAANWKMNLAKVEAEQLMDQLLHQPIGLGESQEVVLSVPFPYLSMVQERVKGLSGYRVAAQNCHHKEAGAYTGEVSANMLASLGVTDCVLGHSERREYQREYDALIAQKVDRCLATGIRPIFCCGEPLGVREAGDQNAFVADQVRAGLFHLDAETIAGIVIAYEPIWAIGTGKTASTEQAQAMHANIRSVLTEQYGKTIADRISILYGGSVKGANASELFGCPDVDGGLVGGASLNATEFRQIIQALS
ncbi:MAG: triose-phosphate isomerase [Bacteroidota bacterium]